MVFQFKFWHSLLNPSSLTYALEHKDEYEKIRGYRRSFWLVFFSALLLFALRNIWGMNTSALTTLFATGLDDRYIFARYISLGSSVLWAIGFFLFHYFAVAYFLHLLTELPFKWIRKVQLYVISFIVVEKALTFIAFIIVGYATPYTFFSLAPTLFQFVQHDYLLYFVNQLTVATVATIWVQYRFLSQWDEGNRKVLMAKIIVIQIILALIVAAISILPVFNWLTRGAN
ncbi:amino acid transporter [Lysinibacillus sp. 54212]|uniref:amino acid transporter n=1 Tax=Lysinibacillus sp. 54212 TaxID=3119829 RepID=UPI002FC7EFFD